MVCVIFGKHHSYSSTVLFYLFASMNRRGKKRHEEEDEPPKSPTKTNMPGKKYETENNPTEEAITKEKRKERGNAMTQ